MSPRAAKYILGATCLILALIPFLLGVETFVYRDWLRLRDVVIYSIVLGFISLALGLTSVGGYILAKRQDFVPQQTQIIFCVSVFGILCLSFSLNECVRSHSMSAQERVLKDLRIIESAVQQKP